MIALSTAAWLVQSPATLCASLSNIVMLQKAFADRAAESGYEMDVSSAGALMKSFDAIEDKTARRLLELRFFKTTGRAKYFCSGMLDIAKYGHYALNVPLYTHFTSPIRRYADILVHRQLEAALQGGGEITPVA